MVCAHFAVLNHLQLAQAVERVQLHVQLHVQFQAKRFAAVCSKNGAGQAAVGTHSQQRAVGYETVPFGQAVPPGRFAELAPSRCTYTRL